MNFYVKFRVDTERKYVYDVIRMGPEWKLMYVRWGRRVGKPIYTAKNRRELSAMTGIPIASIPERPERIDDSGVMAYSWQRIRIKEHL